MKFLIFLANTLILIQPYAKTLAPFVAGFALLAASQSEQKQGFWLRLGLLSLFVCLGTWGAFNWVVQQSFAGQVDKFPTFDLLLAVIYSAAGAAVYFCWLREGQPWVNARAQKLTKRTAAERNKKTDVRDIGKFLPAPTEQYDPAKYFDTTKGIFVGLDETKKPVYIKKSVFDESHILVSGRTRAGKGVGAQVILTQAIQQGDATLILDPKGDRWAPYIFQNFCKKFNKKYRFINLNQSQGYQINPVTGATEEEIENIFISGYGIDEKGDIADFYRLADRAAARECAQWMANNPNSTFASALNALSPNWIDEAKSFHSYMTEMASLPSVNAVGGLNLEDFVKEGGCLYVIGDMSNSRILRAQRMILLRLMLIAKNRIITPESRIITAFADEFKCHISRPFITTLGAAAGWGMHCILAFQSFSDLEDMPKDLDKNAVKGAVIENTAISISYAIKDPVTADFISDMTGEILVDVEVRRVTKNAALSETVDDDRQIRQGERNLFDRNMVMNMPRETAIFSVAGELTKSIHICKLQVEKDPEALKINVVPGDTIITAAELI